MLLKQNRMILLTALFTFAAASMVFGTDFKVQLPQLSKADTNFWVAPDGNDAASGTESAPFATFKRAAEAAVSARNDNPEKSVCVYFKAGEYPMAETVVIKNLSGTSDNPVFFRSAPGASGKCIFTGASSVSGWEPLLSSSFWKSAPEDLKSRLRPEALEKIWTASYLPVETEKYNPGTYGSRQEFFADGQPQKLARWPNEGFAVSGQALGTTERTSWGPSGYAEGIFEADENQPSGWQNEKDAFLFGYWFWDWAESFASLENVEEPAEGRKIISLRKPYHGYGYKHNLHYYGFNLLCELDEPGEFYVERNLKQIFWIPAEGVDPNAVSAKFNRFELPWMITLSDCQNIVFAGLTFEGGFGGAVNISNSHRVFLADLNVERFSGDAAVNINGGSNCGAYRTSLKTLGGGGFILSGGDRKTLTEANHFVSNCKVYDISRIHRTYTPSVLLSGCGMKVEHCDFSESGSSAMRMDGNELLVEYTRFTDLVKESDDQGAVDSWFNPTYRGNVIRYNYWKNIVGGTNCGAAAIRLDDVISGFKIYGNVFVNCGAVLFGAIQIHGGKDNIIENNVFINCDGAVSLQPWKEEYTAMFSDPNNDHYAAVQNICYHSVDINSSLWKERYPELAKIAEEPDVNRMENNYIVNCKTATKGNPYALISQNNTVSDSTADEAEILAPASLEKNGLKPIPVEEIGITNGSYLNE